MGILNFIVDAEQSSRLYQLEELTEKQEKQIEEMRNQIEMLAKWVEYLKENQSE